MSKVNHTLTKAEKRQRRVRMKVRGTTERPRLHVFRSNIGTYLQVIDDAQGKTLAAASTAGIKVKKGETKTQRAEAAAAELGKKLKSINITKLVFDRGGYKYHGRVKAVAEVIRGQGFEF
ncbi:50S ribosomal protein L18 [Patescibacteria group bacterium]|nr:50S ribosomal protein L18 [Patescibacteria group bacterium]